MLLEFMAVIVAGGAMAGIFIGLGKLTKGALPKWTVPAAAGLGMLLTSIAIEYSWYETNTAELPTGSTVIDTAEVQVFYKPWTYVWPYVDGLLAIGPVTETGDLRETSVHRRMRWQTPETVNIQMDCGQGTIARALVGGGYESPVPIPNSDPIFQQICSG